MGSPDAQDKYVLSVVICTYNRDKFIGMALHCLTLQTLSKEKFEIVIIDNNSTDQTASICKAFIEQHPDFHIRYFSELNKGLSFARNRGIKEAQSPLITFIDDDAEAVPGFAECIVQFMQSNPQAVGAGGRVVPKYASGEPRWMNKYLNGFVGKVEFGDQATVYTPAMKYPAGCNMTYTTSILRQVGGFNNKLTFRSDDKYIFHMISKQSSEIYYLPQAMVYHHIDDERLAFGNFKKLFLKTGNEEKIRIRSEEGSTALPKKFIEFAVKTAASVLLYVLFLLKGQEIKGRYIFYSQWFTLQGFLRKDVFVR